MAPLNQEQIDYLRDLNTKFKNKYGANAESEFKKQVSARYGADKYGDISNQLRESYQAGMRPTKPPTPAELAKKNLGVTTEQANNIATQSYMTGTEPSGESGTTSVDTSSITSSETAGDKVIEQIKENINSTNQDVTDKTNAYNTRTQEDLKIAEDNKKIAEDYAKSNAELINNYKSEVTAEMDKYKKTLDDSYKKELDLAKTNLEAQQRENKAAIDLQKYKDEVALKDAEKKNQVNQMKQAWALNKLGLGKSTYAVSAGIRLAEEGAFAIAGLKLQATYNEASAQAKITEQEVNYAKNINYAIDKYTEKSYNLEQDFIKLAAETKNSLLLNEKQKNDKLSEITNNYLKNKRDNEDKIFEAMKAARDEQLKQVSLLQEQYKVQENQYKEKINTLFSTGAWSGLTQEQKIEYASKTGMSLSAIETLQRSAIYSSAVKIMSGILGGDFIPSEAQTSQIISEVNRFMLAGKSMDEAINIATSRIIKSTPEYSDIISNKKIKSSGGGYSRIKTSDMKQDNEGNWFAWTGAEWVSTGLKGKTSSGATPILEKDEEGNLITIDRDTGEANQVYKVTKSEKAGVWPYSPYADSYNTMGTVEYTKTPVKGYSTKNGGETDYASKFGL